ncbi:hypothetical protein Pan216_21090 [Planctomycetes bacterium Pan216]|uniref:Uncharacterized protein n=1 Tax=Kolteria novifilia TaxID=2527975 RepID=A0A518B2Q8_9BACT|nr:hypothetical protein Pan216_21090 [Planctomycetes bacterium Pan216]
MNLTTILLLFVPTQDPSPVPPSPAKAVINVIGTSEPDPGVVVFLDASESVASDHEWSVIPNDAELRPVPKAGKLMMLFSSKYPGPYAVMLSVANGGDAAVAQTIITVQGDIPPGPDDEPILPADGAFQLTKLSFTWAQTLPADARHRSADVAAVFREIGSSVTSDSDCGEVVALTSAGVRKAAAGYVGDWKLYWQPAYQAYMSDLFERGVFNDCRNIKDAWLAIADGLEAAELE